MNTISAGLTPLHAAASRGQVECCKVILGHLTAGQDRNPSDNYGITPLHLAAVKGHIGKALFDILQFKISLDFLTSFKNLEDKWRNNSTPK